VHNVILHIAGREEWAQALADGEIRTPSLAGQGFVHCSDYGTVHLPAGAFYAGRTDLLLVVVDPALVPSPVRWEPGDPPRQGEPLQPGGPWFPHVYGPIPVTAVVGTHEFPPNPDGTFRLPAAIAGTEI
jgi:uncharacterized protein (DUF952 family)